MNPVILTSAYWPNVQYFTKLYAAPYVVMEHNDHYVKQTYRNRCIIEGPDGPLTLTVPVEHGGVAKPTTGEVRVSEHGNWRHLHWNALVSAYEKSPYFFYYADEFRPFYEQRSDRLAELLERRGLLVHDAQRGVAAADPADGAVAEVVVQGRVQGRRDGEVAGRGVRDHGADLDAIRRVEDQ